MLLSDLLKGKFGSLFFGRQIKKTKDAMSIPFISYNISEPDKQRHIKQETFTEPPYDFVKLPDKAGPNRIDMRTWDQIRDDYGHNKPHHLKLVCPKCNDSMTCRCSAPKDTVMAYCDKCRQTSDSTGALYFTSYQGIGIGIEQPLGSMREGTDEDGEKWQVTFFNQYGYIKGTLGKDGDEVDCFLGPNKDSDKVFIIYQKNADGRFDEHKVMFGFDDIEPARNAYLAHYQKQDFLGPIKEMSVEQFKQWIERLAE